MFLLPLYQAKKIILIQNAIILSFVGNLILWRNKESTKKRRERKGSPTERKRIRKGEEAKADIKVFTVKY